MKITMSLAVQIADRMTESIMDEVLSVKKSINDLSNDLVIKSISHNTWLSFYTDPDLFKASTTAVFVNGETRFKNQTVLNHPVNPLKNEIKVDVEDIKTLNSLKEKKVLLLNRRHNTHSYIISRILNLGTIDKIKESYPNAYQVLIECLQEKE